jgi:hypothetical protein
MQKHHPFHLVDPSPWPLFASIAVWGYNRFSWFNGYLYADLLASMSLMSLVYVSIVWWRDLTESVYQGHHTRVFRQVVMV